MNRNIQYIRWAIFKFQQEISPMEKITFWFMLFSRSHSRKAKIWCPWVEYSLRIYVRRLADLHSSTQHVPCRIWWNSISVNCSFLYLACLWYWLPIKCWNSLRDTSITEEGLQTNGILELWCTFWMYFIHQIYSKTRTNFPPPKCTILHQQIHMFRILLHLRIPTNSLFDGDIDTCPI